MPFKYYCLVHNVFITITTSDNTCFNVIETRQELTHPPWDTSTDHAMTGKLLLSVGGKLHPADLPPTDKDPSVFFWDIPAGINFQPEIYIDIIDYMDKKIDLLIKHECQFTWINGFMEDDFADYFRVMSQFRGIQAEFKYGEGFVGHKYLGYFADYKLLP